MIAIGDVWDEAATLAARGLQMAPEKCRFSSVAALMPAAKALQARWPHVSPTFATGLACDQTGPNTFVARPDTYAAVQDTRAAAWRATQDVLRKQLLADLDALTSYQRDLDAMAREALTYVPPLEAIARGLEAQAPALMASLKALADFRQLVNDVSQIVATLVAFVPVVGDLLSLAVTLGTLAWQMRQVGDVTTAEGERVKAGNPNRAQALINIGRALHAYGDLLEAIEGIVRAADGEWLTANRQKAEIRAKLGLGAEPVAATAPVTAVPGSVLAPPRAFALPWWVLPVAASALALWWVRR